MALKLIIYFLTILVLTSCIGDALVTVNYSVKNKTDRPLTVKSKTNWSYSNISKDTSILISPHSKKTVYAARYTCGFSDCRHNIKNDSFLNSVKYYFADKPDQYLKLKADSWTIKKHCAKATIKN